MSSPPMTGSSMYAVCCKQSDGRLEWLSSADSERQALNLSRLWSRARADEIVAVRRLPTGRAEELEAFWAGQALGRKSGIC